MTIFHPKGSLKQAQTVISVTVLLDVHRLSNSNLCYQQLPSSCFNLSALLTSKQGQRVTQCFQHNHSSVASSVRQEAGWEMSGWGFFLPGRFSKTMAELPKYTLACYVVIGTCGLREQEGEWRGNQLLRLQSVTVWKGASMNLNKTHNFTPKVFLKTPPQAFHRHSFKFTPFHFVYAMNFSLQ